MRILKPGFDLACFFEGLKDREHRALLLDYDGTLAPFRERRHQAVPYPGVRGILNEILEEGQTRIVIVSGRPLGDLVSLLGLEETPELWGTHGWERLQTDGSYERAPLSEATTRALDRAYREARALPFEISTHLERKLASVAFHTRGLSAGDLCKLTSRVMERWRALVAESPLELHEFDGGVELRAPGRTKASAVETILRELDGDVGVAYLGDDLTDEDAFRALGERGLSVLVRDRLRETAADLWLRPPRELLDFLRRWHASCRGEKR